MNKNLNKRVDIMGDKYTPKYNIFFTIFMLKYYPYPANDGIHKCYIIRFITNSGKQIEFGSLNMSDFTIHKNVARIDRGKMKIGLNQALILPVGGV